MLKNTVFRISILKNYVSTENVFLKMAKTKMFFFYDRKLTSINCRLKC